MLKRKIDATLASWKRHKNRKPLVIKGCRQCGKTYSVLNFAKSNYANVVYINFFENPDIKTAFSKTFVIDDIILYLSAYIDTQFVPGETCIILDEIQECPDARTALKFFKLDGRFDVIATGSLLGIEGYGEEPVSIPVGYETVITMYPLDFEEFLWANKIGDNVIGRIKESFINKVPVDEPLHNRFREILLRYAIVGGMPEAVNEYLDSKQIGAVRQIQQDIVNGYRSDMIKYAPSEYKSRIRECFDSIPKQLSKENKKFQYSVIKKGAKSANYIGSIQWIEDAGIVNRCYNLTITELPLDGNSIENEFKLYMADIGLLMSMLEEGTASDVLNGSLYGYKGALFENLMADFLGKAGRKLYYFKKDSGLEVDFVERFDGECVLLECKASSGNVKSTKTVLSHPEKYHVDQAFKFGDYNVGKTELERKGYPPAYIYTMPLYMGFLMADS